MPVIEQTREQQSAVARLQTRHGGGKTEIRAGRHGYIEVDIWMPDRVVIYEVSPDGRHSRST